MNNIIISNKKPIVIGRQGENQVTTIKFSIDSLFPHIQNATYGLVHQRHGDAAPYPVTTMAIGGYVNWVINSADVGKVGSGTAQLTAYKDGAVAKSIIFTTITLTSMGTTEAPDPVQIYIDRVVRAGQEAVNAAADAEESAEAAAASAEAAAGSAEEAASSAEAAAGSAEAAAGSASDAATSAAQAGLRANSAEASRNRAMTYANDAYNFATQAGTHAQSAAQARTAAQQSASSAQSAASSAQQILSNISSTVEAELTEAKESGEFDGPGLYGGYSTPILNIIGSTVTYHYGVRKTDFPDLKIGDFVLGRYINAGVISYNILKIESYDSTFDLWAGSNLIPVSGQDGEDGYSPTVTISDITGGHRVTITDLNGNHTFDVMDGEGSEGGTEEIFWATYGTTTSAEIEAAYQAGKLCLVTYGVAAYMLVTRVTGTYHTFGSVSTGGRLGFCLCNNNAWSVSNVPIPTKTSDLTNDSGFVDSAGAASAAPVQSVNGQTGDVTLTIPSSASDVGAIPAPSSPTAGQFLVYDGSAWVAQTVPSASGVSF